MHLADRKVHGFIDRGAWPARSDATGRRRRAIYVRTLEDEIVEVPLDEAKAVFFVRSFDWDTEQPALRFHDHVPTPDCLWARLTFTDGEVIEGMIENGRNFLLEPGFIVTPTDPTGNNWLIYVLKSNVRNFQVLGLRHRTKKKLVSLSS